MRKTFGIKQNRGMFNGKLVYDDHDNSEQRGPDNVVYWSELLIIIFSNQINNIVEMSGGKAFAQQCVIQYAILIVFANVCVFLRYCSFCKSTLQYHYYAVNLKTKENTNVTQIITLKLK